MKKVCSSCQSELELNQFYKKKSKKDGHRSECITCTKIYNALYYEDNSTTIKLSQKTYYKENIESVSKYNIEYKKINKDKLAEQQKEYRKNSKIERNEWERDKKKNDANYRISSLLRTRITKICKNKAGSAVRDLGCSIEFFKDYIEQLFHFDLKTGEIMTWENWGQFGWHMDHIVPLSSFDLTNREQFLKACHYTNLQPLWWWENLSKGKKVVK